MLQREASAEPHQVDANHRFGEVVTFVLRGEEAVGRIVFCFRSGTGKLCFHVRDDAGEYWHRQETEVRASA